MVTGESGQVRYVLRRTESSYSKLGSCKQTIDGGNHWRYWQQNGSLADSNAIFIA